MLADAPNLNCLWAVLIVEELTRCGVTEFVLSPGSRCTPLTVAVARNERAHATVHYDERGAAFFALGIAKASCRPVALICTSGTAVANYLPAVVEASQSGTPLILLTADRPPELLDTGANQTIDQNRIYGNYVRWFVNLPCPDIHIAPEFVLSTVDQAVFRATRFAPGPVHLNCAYREPLEPVHAGDDLTGYLDPLREWVASSKREPYTSYQSHISHGPDFVRIAEMVATCDTGAIVVGAMDDSAAENVCALAEQLQWPVFADIGSGVRLKSANALIVHHIDLILATAWGKSRPAPGVILQFGTSLVSKRLSHYLMPVPGGTRALVSNTPSRIDPGHGGGIRVVCDPGFAARAISESCDVTPKREPMAWARGLLEASDQVGRCLDSLLNADAKVSEPAVVRVVSQMAPENTPLFLANSMPVRDAGMFGAATTKGIRDFTNRGASGIDGNVATAAGIARSSGRRTVAILGDLALLHDLNSLALVASSHTPVIVVVLNNNGGGIFHFLPIAGHADVFEPYFGTPHGMTFEHAARQFSLAYTCPSDMIGFRDAFTRALQEPHSTLIEVRTDRNENLAFHRRILAELDKHIVES